MNINKKNYFELYYNIVCVIVDFLTSPLKRNQA